MKRLVSLLVLLLFVFGMAGSLVGCVSGDPDVDQPGNADVKGKDLTIVSFNDIGLDVEGNSFYEAKKHYEETTGGKVTFRRYSPNVFISKMITLIGSGKSPDLVYCRWAEMPKLAAMDILQPVDSYISTEETNFPQIAEGYNFQGEHYALRIEQVLPYMMWYNKSILQEYGCDDPYTVWKNNPADWNWDKFEEIAVACTDDRDRDGVTDLWGFAGMPYFDSSNAVKWIVTDGNNATINWKSKESLEAFDFLQRLRFDLEVACPNNEYGSTNFKTGDVAMTLGFYEFYYEYARDMDPETVGLAPMPQGPSFDGTYSCQTNILGIAEGASNPEGAALFAKYMNEQDKANYAGDTVPLGSRHEQENILTEEMLEVARFTRKNATVSMTLGWGDWEQQSNAVWINLFWDKKDVVATLDSLQPIVQAAINETLNFQMPEVKDFEPQPAATFENNNMSYVTFDGTAAQLQSITTEASQIIEGQASLLMSGNGGDAVVMRTDPAKLDIPTYHEYKVTFDWSVVDSVDKTMGCDFYATFRPLSDINSTVRQIGNTSFGGVAGDFGTVEMTASLSGNVNDYVLVIVNGLNGGTIVVDSLNIEEVK
ncbi:MAG: extracellular solute-binding protein [Clostridia bacterium]|nr:extracellular solute-binding protein [Clostridia bacterium]